MVKLNKLPAILAFGLVSALAIPAPASAWAWPWASVDTRPPSIPLGLKAQAIGVDEITIEWKASSDNVDVWGYAVFRSGQFLATSKQTVFTDKGLKPGTAYRYTIIAFDQELNRSRISAPLEVTTLASDGGGPPADPPSDPPNDPPADPPETAAQAVGLVMVDDGDADSNEAGNLKFVDGWLIRVDWAKMETEPGKYQFKSLCDRITAAHKAGKWVTLANFAQAPAWLVNDTPAAGQWVGPFRNQNQPMPWDENALDRLRQFAEAEAAYSCEGYPINKHPSVKNVDTSILAAQSIRKFPPYEIGQLTKAVVESVRIWREAFGQAGHNFYTGLFPVGTSTADAIAIRDAVQAVYPDQSWFQETLTGAGPSGNLAEPLKPGKWPFSVMLQACGYWSDVSRIKCVFANSDSPLTAFNGIVKKLKGRYIEYYPDDLLKYRAEMETIHAELWQPQ